MFEFHAELFEDRATAMEVLERNGFAYLADYTAIDLLHDRYGLEVGGIKDEADARRMLTFLRAAFPAWPHVRTSYHDKSRDTGWKVEISRHRSGGDRRQTV